MKGETISEHSSSDVGNKVDTRLVKVPQLYVASDAGPNQGPSPRLEAALTEVRLLPARDLENGAVFRNSLQNVPTSFNLFQISASGGLFPAGIVFRKQLNPLNVVKRAPTLNVRKAIRMYEPH